MSGGIAYIWDQDGKFNLNCNLATVELEKIESAEEEAEVKEMIRRHQQFTESVVAGQVLDDWDGFMQKCIKVMPTDYKRVLKEMEKEKETAGV